VIDFDRSEKDHSSRFRVRGVFTQTLNLSILRVFISLSPTGRPSALGTCRGLGGLLTCRFDGVPLAAVRAAPWIAGDKRIAPYLGVYGDYRFQTDNALPAGQPIVGIGDGWSGRVTSGITWTWRGGGTLAFGSEYGGFGASYKVWTANGRYSLAPLKAADRPA
jgi:hypothetical protein